MKQKQLLGGDDDISKAAKIKIDFYLIKEYSKKK